MRHLFFCLPFVIAGGCHEAPGWQFGPFEKHASNPVLMPRGDSWQSKDVFNPIVWADSDGVWMLYRAEDSTGAGRWNGTSRIGLARSADGLRFEAEPDPVLVPTEAWELPGGCEDPRVVRIGDTFVETYTAYDRTTARLALAMSPDFRSWTKHGLVFPERGWTRSSAILTEPIGGRYWMYFGIAHVWAAWSYDALRWTAVEEPVLSPPPRHHDSRFVEPGPQPTLTKRGIALLYNGADSSLVYSPGQALFDRNDPTRLIGRTDDPFMEPTTDLERTWQVPNVVFAQGLAEFAGTRLPYFGMGDSGIGAAIHLPPAY